jgi:alcohol dehydrogenase
VLILGASGGVGVCCLQIAKLAGPRSSPAPAPTPRPAPDRARRRQDDQLRHARLPDEVYKLYGKPTRRGGGTDRGVDMVVNYTGGDTWVKSLKVLKVGGRMVTCGATAATRRPRTSASSGPSSSRCLGSNGWMRSTSSSS